MSKAIMFEDRMACTWRPELTAARLVENLIASSSVVPTVPYDDWDDSPCYNHGDRSWKSHRSTQYRHPEASAKVLMPVLLAMDEAY